MFAGNPAFVPCVVNLRRVLYVRVTAPVGSYLRRKPCGLLFFGHRTPLAFFEEEESLGYDTPWGASHPRLWHHNLGSLSITAPRAFVIKFGGRKSFAIKPLLWSPRLIVGVESPLASVSCGSPVRMRGGEELECIPVAPRQPVTQLHVLPEPFVKSPQC